jgi:hypothetical protein
MFPVESSLFSPGLTADASLPALKAYMPEWPMGAGSGFDGANWSSRRGYVYYPTLNTQREVPPWSRLEMIRRSRWLRRNTGYAKRCTDGSANMVGWLSPRASTDDREWNGLADTAWERRAGNANTFERSGRWNVYGYQPLITKARLGDGDFCSVLTSSQSGGAMVASYEAHQLGNATTDLLQDQWRDGVRVIADRAVQFRLLNPDDATQFTDIAAQDFILHADFLSVGHRRGVTALHHALNNLLDITEIRSDVKLGIKLANRIGYYIARDQLTAGNKPRGMGGKPTLETTETGEEVVIENVYRGGKMLTLKPGEEIKQLLDQRPHPNSREFLEDLNRDIAWGLGLSPDVLWNISKIGGASVRYVLADAQVWIEAQQQILVDQFLQRFWVYFISKEIKAGRLRPPTDPDWYYKVGWQPPAKLTVDIGRDGKLSIDLHRSGMLTMKRWYGAQGLDDETEIRQFVREYAQRIKICQEVGDEFGIKLDPDKVFPPLPGQAAPMDGANILTPDSPDFASTENIQRVLTEIRDGLAELRVAA